MSDKRKKLPAAFLFDVYSDPELTKAITDTSSATEGARLRVLALAAWHYLRDDNGNKIYPSVEAMLDVLSVDEMLSLFEELTVVLEETFRPLDQKKEQ